MSCLVLHLLLIVAVLFPCFCLGFSTLPRHNVWPSLSPALSAVVKQDENSLKQDETNDSLVDDDLVAACEFSETFGPDKERLTIDGERILYRLGRIHEGRWISGTNHTRPVPHLYETTNQEDLVIDRNGYSWRTQETLRNKGLTRHNMEATQQLLRPQTVGKQVVQMPIPWNGPLNLPPRERGFGSNRKLRDEAVWGCELDDERWLIYLTKLATYSVRFGNVDVPLEWKEDESLGRWVFKQRVLYRRYARNNYYQHKIQKDGTFGNKVNPLSPWRIQMLYDLGFSFKINLRWHDRLAQLERFKERHGHVQVPSDCKEDEFRGLNLWIQTQRTANRRWKAGMPSSMTKRKFVLLNRLGLDWDPLASMWDARIEQLQNYRKEHGHARVTKSQNYELASWLIYLRSQYRIYQESPWESALTPERIKVLEELGMDWEPRENRWQQQFEALVEFQKQNGHTVVPVDYSKDPSLSLWVQKQRHDYRTGSIFEEDEAQLQSIGFVFDLYDAAFQRGLEKLKEFRKEHGDCRVPRSYSDQELVSFVKRQRTQYTRLMNGESSSLTEERIRQLQDVGFEWRVRSNEWEENFAKLRAYYDTHGNCNVPSDFEDQALHRFVSAQRTLYKRLQNGESVPLSPSRIKKLESISFAWNTNHARWMERYNELMEFQRENGHCNVPDKYIPNGKLGSWVRNQRVQYRNMEKGRKSTLTPSRIELLEEIGFQWSVRKLARQQ